MKLQIAPGTLTALAGRHDRRAHYVFSGDLSQMGTIEAYLRMQGFAVVKCDVYPGFPKDQFSEYIRALRLLYEEKIEGWWNQEEALIAHGICTPQEFRIRLEEAPTG